jgi:hypothetical protein
MVVWDGVRSCQALCRCWNGMTRRAAASGVWSVNPVVIEDQAIAIGRGSAPPTVLAQLAGEVSRPTIPSTNSATSISTRQPSRGSHLHGIVPLPNVPVTWAPPGVNGWLVVPYLCVSAPDWTAGGGGILFPALH